MKVQYAREPKGPHPTTFTDVVSWCENQLGWLPRSDVPRWKALQMEASKLKQAAKKDRRVTPAALYSAARYCVHRRIEIKSPYGLIFYLDYADEVKAAADLPSTVDEAVTRERQVQAPGWEDWVRRLVRSTGSGRTALLEEWAEQRQRELEQM